MMCRNKGGKSTDQSEASNVQAATAAPTEKQSTHPQAAEQKAATEQAVSRFQA
ncbi:hypothetical protein [Natronospirillum operosum]|nr:hypothetical protein [Natronospirillum operosum]